MDEEQEWRFANLRKSDVDPKFLLELHGLRWPFVGDLQADFTQMLVGARNKPTLAEGHAPRFHIERFLDVQGLDSARFAAAKLGMQPDSLQDLLPRLPEVGLRSKYAPYPDVGLVARSLSEDLTRKLPGLRFRTFGSHDAFCRQLQDALKQVFGLEVAPLYCWTQDEMLETESENRIFASSWDNLTMQPLSVKHQVWLNLGKPLSLAPDRCSKLFYARNRDRLCGHLAGTGEPRDMEAYFRFLEAHHNA